MEGAESKTPVGEEELSCGNAVRHAGLGYNSRPHPYPDSLCDCLPHSGFGCLWELGEISPVFGLCFSGGKRPIWTLYHTAHDFS